MLWLLLSMVLSAANFIWFRLFERWQADTRLAVAINYIICVSLAFWSMPQGGTNDLSISQPWLPAAFVIGFLYVALFVLIGHSARVLGVNITTTASKMSFVVPMAAAYLYTHSPFDWRHGIALVLALLAIWWQSTGGELKVKESGRWLLPLFIFLGGGLADGLLQYTEKHQLPPVQQPLFLMTLFGTAGIFGWIGVGLLSLQKQIQWNWRSVGAGTLLGSTNFSAVYLLLKAFGTGLPAAFVFPMLNVGIILLTSLAAALLFAEKPHGKQWWGLAAALGAILLYASSL